MPSMFDVNPNALLKEASLKLKEEKSLSPPAWAKFVKTGAHKERPPVDDDWWYMRSASVLRKIRINGPIGVSKLRRYYGGKKNNGMAPEHFVKGSGNILRKVLQQLESAGLAKQVDISGKKGRVITPKGVALLDKASQKIMAGSEKTVLIPQSEKFKPLKQKTHESIVEELMKNRTRNPRPQRPQRGGGRGGGRRYE